MSIVLVGSTSGSVTLQEPAVAGTTVLTLPAVSGTVLTTGSSGQSIPKAALPTGSVLQVVSGTYSTQTTTTSNTFVTTNLSATITPTSATSKIYISYGVGDVGTTNPNDGVGIAIYRNGSIIGNDQYVRIGYVDSTATENVTISPASGIYFDSPASTSAQTYVIRFKSSGSAGPTATVFRDNTQGSIVLMEIAA